MLLEIDKDGWFRDRDTISVEMNHNSDFLHHPSPSPAMNSKTPLPAWPIAFLVLCGGLFSLGMALLTVLEDWLFAQAYFAQSTWQGFVIWLGGQLQADDAGEIYGATLPSPEKFIVLTAMLGGLVWIIGSWVAARRSGTAWSEAARTWALRGGRWLGLLLLWSQGRVIAYLLGGNWLHLLLAATNEFVWAGILGVVAAEWWRVCDNSQWHTLKPGLSPGGRGESDKERLARGIIWGGFAVYALVYTAMNWGLWFNMRIPHGDSAMYEEHLWNIWHGKGFRSYLDQGLFLGEHIQVIHLTLLPLHLIWPSQLMLELCQSLAIGATVFPVYSIAKRHTGRPLLAAVVGLVALLYFPLHYLDISIDVKTFRPTALAIPAVLAAIDAYEAGRMRRMLLWVLVVLSTEEYFTLVIGPLGLWMAWDGWRTKEAARKWWGVGLLAGSAVYLLIVMKFLLPYFREGITIHYASYFSDFGQTPGEIIVTMLTSPLRVVRSLVNLNSLSWFLCLLAPLGGLPLLSPSRLLTAAPLFVLLCLNKLAQQPAGPFHHFHAPIVPLMLWAMAAGVGRLVRGKEAATASTLTPSPSPGGRGESAGWGPGPVLAFAVACSLWTGACFSQHPLSFRFWDSGKVEYWRDRYVPDRRPAEWAKVESLIPVTANVASTDYVHPRLTHHNRSYDYSKYRRKVAGGTTGVPADTDYIVIDTRHPYSWIRGPEDVRELQTEPEKWELLPDQTSGYFLILKRRDSNHDQNR